MRERYQSRGLVLALGAGLSIGCKLPSWPELLLRIGQDCLGKRGRDTVQQLIDSGMTLPAIAGILESKRPKGASFRELVKKALYQDFPFEEAINTEAQQNKLVQFVQKCNPTMRAVAAFCAARSTSEAPFTANERICAVVNFNLDSVLRSYARARYGSYLFRTIESATKLSKIGRIPIYHMHGFLKFYKSNRPDDDEEVPCVLTEGEYYDSFNRPHSMFNYTFLYLLREYNCLFIGMSMNDENIRRLLHYSTTERRYQAKERSKNSERIALRHFAILKRSGTAKVDELTDVALKRLGTRALWMDDFNELPERLGYIYSNTGWKEVY